jgi:hypothetical protein
VRIANYIVLAIKIKPEVDRMIGSEININTIVVSIKRIATPYNKIKILTVSPKKKKRI